MIRLALSEALCGLGMHEWRPVWRATVPGRPRAFYRCYRQRLSRPMCLEERYVVE